MRKRDGTRVVAWLVVGGLVGVLMVGGCGSNRSFSGVHLPDTPRLVGGGMMIEWRAPECGTAYLVEKRTRKIIETRSLEEGAIFSFSATSVIQADEFEQMLGIRFSRAQFQLYFEPNSGNAPCVEAGAPERLWDRF